MTEPAEDTIVTIPAATVVVFRRGRTSRAPELLMVQRSQEMRFAGGAAVFPGGRIDPADAELAARLLPESPAEDAAARIAALRETLEETGLALGLDRPVTPREAADARAFLLEQGSLAPVLDRFDWTLRTDSLVPFARWCPMWQKSFDTHFFLADLGTGDVDLAVDETENTRLFWASAADSLAMADAGEISVIFPTRCNLERLALFASFIEARAQAERIPPRMITPWREERDGDTWLTIPEGLGYPLTSLPLAKIRRG